MRAPAAQPRLFCPWGAAPAGRCRPCRQHEADSRRRFGGHRDRVLRRDRGACRVCGASAGIVVHHRRPGRHRPDGLITLCRACHAPLHRRFQPAGVWPELLVILWEEQHLSWPRHLALGFADTASVFRTAA